MAVELKANSVLKVEIEGRKYKLVCDSDSPLGQLHDALMQMKGWSVERMGKAQKEEEAIAEEIKAKSDCCSDE